jgi:hypothetical protein
MEADHDVLQQIQQIVNLREASHLQRTTPSIQLVLLYDSKTKKDMNWNKIDETAISTIRALHISQVCERSKSIGK